MLALPHDVLYPLMSIHAILPNYHILTATGLGGSKCGSLPLSHVSPVRAGGGRNTNDNASAVMSNFGIGSGERWGISARLAPVANIAIDERCEEGSAFTPAYWYWQSVD